MNKYANTMGRIERSVRSRLQSVFYPPSKLIGDPSTQVHGSTEKGRVYLVNTDTLPTPGSHYFTSMKFLKGFGHLGYQVMGIQDIGQIRDSDDSIVLISDHGLRRNFEKGVEELCRLANEKPEAIFLCWHFHEFIGRKQLQMPFLKWILTGEHLRKKPTGRESGLSWTHVDSWNLQQTMHNYVPLTFSADISPEQVGTFPRKSVFDAQFVGSGYKEEWTSKLKNCYIRNTPPFVSESERIDSYLKSHVSLGFHSEGNIRNHCIVERVFDGMAYGCVVLTDNPTAEEETGGIVEYVNSFEGLADKIDYYARNEKARQEKQAMGYDYIRTRGCYLHVAEGFLLKMNELGFHVGGEK